jgi:NTE family protein
VHEPPLSSNFIQVSFRELAQPDKRVFFNRISTSFSLTDEQVDSLIAAGRELLQANPEFRRLLRDLKADADV